MKPNEIAATAAAFGAEGGPERGNMFQIWAFRCACAALFISWMYDVDNAASVAKTNGWRYTSKRGWECPEHRRAK